MAEGNVQILLTEKSLNICSANETIEGIKSAHCRICLENGTELIQPCGCKGTVAYVHSECLKEWIERKEQIEFAYNISKELRVVDCELCHGAITYQARTIHSLSATEFSRKWRKFPAFFIVHTAFMLLMLIINAVLGEFLKRVIEGNKPR